MRHDRSGRVYLMEVLVALFAIGLLVSLLLPLMQVSRDGGPGYGCKNNLRMCFFAMSLGRAVVAILRTQ